MLAMLAMLAMLSEMISVGGSVADRHAAGSG
jgi:hypothetical protein